MANRDSLGRYVLGHSRSCFTSIPKGTRNSPNTEFKKGIIPWNKGEKHSVVCGVCGITFLVHPFALGKRRFCSKQCGYIGREAKCIFQSGEKHPAWKGGLSIGEYPKEFCPRLKNKIRKRDNYICQLCGVTEEEHLEKYGRRLCVNHIDFNKKNCSEDNLNTLCNSCNTRISWDREKWTLYFQSKMKHNGE